MVCEILLISDESLESKLRKESLNTMVQIISDKYKLLLLALSISGCALTYFLPFASRHLASPIKIMPPPIDKYCHSFQEKYRGVCKTEENSVECDNLRSGLQDCRSAIISAYKQINISCLKYSVLVQLCISDCPGGESSEDGELEVNEEDCTQSCHQKAEKYTACQKGIVAKELRSFRVVSLSH